VLDDPRQGTDAPDVVEWLKQNRFYMTKTPKWAAAIRAPSGRLRAVAIRAEGWFIPTDDGMLFAKLPADGKLTRVEGYTVGDRGPRGWVHQRDIR
jgi:hypothetical protein